MFGNSIVIGMGYGDEGKGITTDYLSSKNPKATVVRFSGGQQAGHTVKLNDGRSHVFSTFGSGTLRGNHTHLSKFCTVDPICLMNEYDVLVDKRIVPSISIDPQCPITTPFEVYANRNDIENRENGSCGKGIWATYKREQDGYSLWAMDLKYPEIVAAKLENLSKYYGVDLKMDRFFECVKAMLQFVEIKEFNFDNIEKYTPVIFEGSQGLLLDECHGFYPNITPSHTGLSNALSLASIDNIYLVTRAYQTRHGNGFMTNENMPNNIKENGHEINVTNEFQGNFRRSILDIDLLNYGLERHGFTTKYKNFVENRNVNLVVTNLDQIEDAWCFTKGGKLYQFENEEEFLKGIWENLVIKVKHIITSHSPISDNFEEYRMFYRDTNEEINKMLESENGLFMIKEEKPEY